MPEDRYRRETGSRDCKHDGTQRSSPLPSQARRRAILTAYSQGLVTAAAQDSHKVADWASSGV